MNAIAKPSRRNGGPVVDYGPAIQHRNGGLVKGERADPDNPNRKVMGATRRSGYDWLHSRKVITDTQREAADRYCVAHERHLGASEKRRAVIARTPPWQQGHPTMEQMAATADIRVAHAVIKPGANRLVLDGVALHGTGLEALAASLSEPVAGVTGRLRAVLDILASQWGID